jgi:hypothetical protein
MAETFLSARLRMAHLQVTLRHYEAALANLKAALGFANQLKDRQKAALILRAISYLRRVVRAQVTA